MRKTTKTIIFMLIISILIIGIGYATIQNITLNIKGTAMADPSQSNFKVMFSGTPEVSDNTYVTAAITDDINATINVDGLTTKGDIVTATYTIQNVSTDISSDLSVNTTNSNTEFFTLKSKLEKTSLMSGEATTLTVTVELTKTPIKESVSSIIGVRLTATPVEPGAEGTSGTTNDYSQSPIESQLNEFGFYYDKAYSCYTDEGIMSVCFYEDTSMEMYIDKRLRNQISAGNLEYDYLTITNIVGDNVFANISSNGKKMDIGGMVFEMDETFFENSIPEGSYYIGIELVTNELGEEYEIAKLYNYIPLQIQNTDIYISGDYIYSYKIENDGWSVAIFEDYAKNYIVNNFGIQLKCEVTNRYKESYGPILEEINGKPIVDLGYTFESCNKLKIAPKIPRSVTNMQETFVGCINLITAHSIPSCVINMDRTFWNCRALAGEITINVRELIRYNECFFNVDMSKIILTGEASKEILNLLGSTGNNYTVIP